MRNYVLDTSLIIEILRGRDFGQFLIDELSLYEEATKIFVSSITKGELNPLDETRSGMKKSLLEKFYELSIEIPPSIRELINSFSYLNIQNKKLGLSIGQNDLWIAATANYLKMPIASSDKDFKKLEIHNLLPYGVLYYDPKPF